MHALSREPFGSAGQCGLFSRRAALLAVAGGAGSMAAITAIGVPAALAAAEMPEWMRSLLQERLGRNEFRDGRVHLAMPDRADTGFSVPLEASVPDSPMTPADFVRSLHVISTRNPQPLVSDYYFTSRSGVAKVSQRIRLSQSQYVFGFAIMSDDSAWMTVKYVSVAHGACAVDIFLPDEEQARRRRE